MIHLRYLIHFYRLSVVGVYIVEYLRQSYVLLCAHLITVSRSAVSFKKYKNDTQKSIKHLTALRKLSVVLIIRHCKWLPRMRRLFVQVRLYWRIQSGHRLRFLPVSLFIEMKEAM